MGRRRERRAEKCENLSPVVPRGFGEGFPPEAVSGASSWADSGAGIFFLKMTQVKLTPSERVKRAKMMCKAL